MSALNFFFSDSSPRNCIMFLLFLKFTHKKPGRQSFVLQAADSNTKNNLWNVGHPVMGYFTCFLQKNKQMMIAFFSNKKKFKWDKVFINNNAADEIGLLYNLTSSVKNALFWLYSTCEDFWKSSV